MLRKGIFNLSSDSYRQSVQHRPNSNMTDTHIPKKFNSAHDKSEWLCGEKRTPSLDGSVSMRSHHSVSQAQNTKFSHARLLLVLSTYSHRIFTRKRSLLSDRTFSFHTSLDRISFLHFGHKFYIPHRPGDVHTQAPAKYKQYKISVSSFVPPKHVVIVTFTFYRSAGG
jgi:hypothetical protein